MASTAKIGEKPFASWKKIGAVTAAPSGRGDDHASSATVTARPWTLPRAAAVSDQPEGDQRRDASGQDHQPDREAEATAHGDEPGGPASKAYAQDIADGAHARRIDRTIDVWQPSAGHEKGDKGGGGRGDDEGGVPTDWAKRFTRVSEMPTPAPWRHR
jgi:hypothetical protein